MSGARGARRPGCAPAAIAALGAVLAAWPVSAQRAPVARFVPTSVALIRPGAAPAGAAQPRDSTGTGMRFGQSVLAATVGSGVGLLAGWFGGAMLGIGGGDDPGLEGALLGAAFGSAAGAGLGASEVQRAHGITRPLPFAIGAGLAGVGGGVASVALANYLGARKYRLLAAYVLGQGTVTAAIASLTWR